MNLSEVSSLTEDQAREYFERIRWPNGPVCPHCSSIEWIKLEGRTVRSGLYKCHAEDCQKQFTATVNTILEDTHLPIRTWLMAFSILCSAKGGRRASVTAATRDRLVSFGLASLPQDQTRDGQRAYEGLIARRRRRRCRR